MFLSWYQSEPDFPGWSHLLCRPSVGAQLPVWSSRVPHQKWWYEEGLSGALLCHFVLQACSFSRSTLQRSGVPDYWPERTAACHVSHLHVCFRNPEWKRAETLMITSVPPDVKMMSSTFPPTILATFSLDWLIIALALVPRNNKDLNNTYFFKTWQSMSHITCFTFLIQMIITLNFSHLLYNCY